MDYPLHDAIQRCDFELVEKCLKDRTADVNSLDDTGMPPLIWAVYSGNIEMVKLLLANGASPNVRNSQDGTPLFWARDFGMDEIARILLSHGAHE